MPQNDRQNLSFVEDEDTHGKKMARKVRTKVIYKGTFVSKQSLVITLVSYLVHTLIWIVEDSLSDCLCLLRRGGGGA